MKADCGVIKIRQKAGRTIQNLRDLMFLGWWLWRACSVVTPCSYIFSLFHYLFTHDIFFQTEGRKLVYGDIERNVISVHFSDPAWKAFVSKRRKTFYGRRE